jgi:TIR domain
MSGGPPRARSRRKVSLVRRWDLFISHAAEDKQDAAIPLIEALERAGMTVWFDAYELKIGDSLREKIDSGLGACQYGVIILSPNFIAKQWPRRELNALFALEEDGRPRILPVWHNLDRTALVSYSPILADRIAGNTGQGFNSLAKDISKVIFGDDSSPAVQAPSLARRLVKILEGSAEPERIREFLAAHDRILERAVGGRELRIQPGIRFNVAIGDLFVGSYLPTRGSWRWQLIMLGKVHTQENLSSELERIDSQVSRIRNSVASDLLVARHKLRDITADFRATIVIGRRASLADHDLKVIRDYNDSAHDVEVRTYDWLIEAAFEERR